MRLLVFSTSTMGECDMVVCEAADVVATISEEMGLGAEGVEDITDDPERARELVRHFDEFDLYVGDDVREWVAGWEVPR